MARRLEEYIQRQYADSDKILQTCADFLSSTDVQRVTNGLAERALNLLSFVYIPNYRYGAYQLSEQQYDGQGIPFILTRGKKKVQIQRNAEHAIHPEQVAKLCESFQTVEKQSITPDDLGLRLDVLRMFHEQEYGEKQLVHDDLAGYDACVYAPTALIGLGTTLDDVETYFTYTNPIVVGRSEVLLDDEGDILFHELVHVHQSLAGELVKSSSKKARESRPRAELEAYWAQASALEARTGINVDKEHDWNCYGIEAARREINKNARDPFKISRALLRAIEQNGSRLY